MVLQSSILNIQPKTNKNKILYKQLILLQVSQCQAPTSSYLFKISNLPFNHQTPPFHVLPQEATTAPWEVNRVITHEQANHETP
jgi:hypothetical protein